MNSASQSRTAPTRLSSDGAKRSKVFDGQWHHIVAVRDVPAKTLFLYADGELVQTMEDTSGAINCPNENFVIGNVNVGFDNPLQGHARRAFNLPRRNVSI